MNLKNGGVSFWYRDIGELPKKFPSLSSNVEADVCIIGGGYTGLWTAYYLKKIQPKLTVIILEKEFCGFGASGRNGGWLTGGFAWDHSKYLESSDERSVQLFVRRLLETVPEILDICQENNINADIASTSEVRVATNSAQVGRLKHELQTRKSWGVSEDRVSYIKGPSLEDIIKIPNAQGALVMDGVARVQPAKLVQGLRSLVSKLGVDIYEDTLVTDYESGVVSTSFHKVKSRIILRTTEGFSANFKTYARDLLPLNSAQIVTHPIDREIWSLIGWDKNELIGDYAHSYFYAQRTREGRIALGGRGVPYRFGSVTDKNGITQKNTIFSLEKILYKHFPLVKEVGIDHAWCGTLGVPRDWCASVNFNRETGLGWAGGYVGVGVSTSNLAGQTLADLCLDRKTDNTKLPWINRHTRKWETEPLRWFGVRSMHKLLEFGDAREEKNGTPSRAALVANYIMGRSH